MVLVQFLPLNIWTQDSGGLHVDTVTHCVTVGTEICNGNSSRLLEADVMLIEHPAVINTFSKM
jgi:hypothetical protein